MKIEDPSTPAPLAGGADSSVPRSGELVPAADGALDQHHDYNFEKDQVAPLPPEDMPPWADPSTQDGPEMHRSQSHASVYDHTPVTPLVPRGSQFLLDEDAEPDDGVRNHQFLHWLEEDRLHASRCRTLPLTMITWLAFLFVAWHHGNIDETFRMRECLRSAIHEVEAPHTIVGLGQSINQMVQYSSITSVGEMWSWLDAGLVPAIAGPPTKPGFVRTFNQVIGGIQLRQTRFKYGDCQVGDALTAYYRQKCHGSSEISDAAFKVVAGTATSLDKCFLPGYGLSGKLSEYNKKRFFAWLDTTKPLKGRELVTALKAANWIDDSTKSLEAIIVFFNAQLQSYGHINVKMILERGGLVKQELEVRTLWATMYPKWWYILFDVFWLLCVLKFIANSVQKVVDAKEARTSCGRCCQDIWFAMDWMGIVLALALMVFLIVYSSGFSSLAQKVGALGPFPSVAWNATATQRTAYEVAAGQYYENEADIVDHIEFLVQVKIVHRLGMYWYAMIFLARWFKGFDGQARMSQITRTIASAAADLVHFGIIFLVLFVNFALAGHVLFGSEVAEWSNLTKSFQSALAMAFGRVDFAPLHRIAPISSLIWLYGYVLSIVCLSMNMLVAIIADHYGDVFHSMNAGDKGHGMFGQLHAMAFDAWWHGSYVARWLYRILYVNFPKRVKKVVPLLQPEEERLDVPYSQIRAYCERRPLDFTNVNMLLHCGCDEATAVHLLKNCEAEVLRHLPEFYPLDELFDEFDESMKQYYFAMDTFSNELRSWFNEKSIFSSKMIPRQTKLDSLSKNIKTKEHREHVHKHHHRKHHNDDEEDDMSKSNRSGSRSGSQGGSQKRMHFG